MKFNYIYGLMTVLATGIVFTSCIDDDSTYGVPDSTPVLKVNGTQAGQETRPVEVNGYFGSEMVIVPRVEYNGDESKLSYEWGVFNSSVNSTGASDDGFEVVSTEREFHYNFSTGGTWTVRLKVTDGIVGFSQEYTALVNRTFEAGYCVISNTTDGSKGNLVFLKDMTPEETEQGVQPVVMENVLGVVCNSYKNEPVVDLKVLKLTYAYPATTVRICVSTSDYCYFLDPASFTEAASVRYADVIGGFKAKNLYGFSTVTRAYDPVSKRYVTIDAQNYIPYEDSSWKDKVYDAVFGGHYLSYGVENYDNYYVNRSPLAVYNSYFAYDENWNTVNLTSSSRDVEYEGKTLFDGETLVTAFMGETQIEHIETPYYDYDIENYPAYFITTDGSNYYCTSLSGLGSSSMDPVGCVSRVALRSGNAVPSVDSRLTPSNLYHRTYFYNGNHVYVMLFTDNDVVTPSPSQWALEYPAGEEITYIGVDAESTEGEEILIVATVNSVTGRGNVYFYDARDVRTDNPGAEPFKTYKNCADRISDIFYKGRY